MAGDPSDVVDVERLPQAQYLIMELLASRYRTGEQCWTFPYRFRHQLEVLGNLGLITWWRHRPGWALASLTEAGKKAVLDDGYTTPRDREPLRVVVVVDWHGRKVYGLTSDDAEAQDWVRALTGEHGPDAATMTAAVVTPVRKERAR